MWKLHSIPDIQIFVLKIWTQSNHRKLLLKCLIIHLWDKENGNFKRGFCLFQWIARDIQILIFVVPVILSNPTVIDTATFPYSVPRCAKFVLVSQYPAQTLVCYMFPLEKFFTHRETDGIGLQIWTYARHSWPLSREGFLTCHTYCSTAQPFIMVISPRTRDTHT